MKVIIEKKDLLPVVSHIYSVTERKSTIPILLNIKIEAEDILKFTATNIDIEIVEQSDANIVSTGGVTVPASTLFEIVKRLPDGEVVMETMEVGESKLLYITAGKGQFSLPTLPVEDFPVMGTGDIPFKFSVSPDDLIKLIDKTRFAVSTEEARYTLNGIYLHVANSKGNRVLRAVATDAHRLALTDVNCPVGLSDGMPGIIIPSRLVSELRKLLDTTSSEIKVETSDSKIRFSFGSIVITSKLIEGKFPNYEKVIPTSNDKVLVLDTKLFMDAVDRVSSVSFDKTKSVKLNINRDGLKVSAESQDSGGSGKEEIGGTYNSDDSVEVGFNAKYLIDIAGQIEGENIRFTIADSSSPALVSEIDDDSLLYVLMPMRI